MTYGLDPKQLVLYIIRPVLQRELGLWSPPAEVLVLGTALTESDGALSRRRCRISSSRST